MKNIFALIILFSFITSFSIAQTNYTFANSGIANNFSAYDFMVKSPTEVYVVGGMLNGNMFIGGAIYKLANEDSWSPVVTSGLIGYNIYFSSGVAGNKMFLSGRKSVWQHDIFSSIDGKNWKLSGNGIPVNYVTTDFVAKSSDTIFAFGTLLDSVTYNHTRNIYRSIDTGNNWHTISTYGLPPTSYRATALIGEKILLSSGFEVYSSFDGIYWNTSQSGLPYNFETYEFVVLSDTEVYASGGIWNNIAWSPAMYKSNNGGNSWTEHIYSGLPYSNYPLHAACFTGNVIFQSLSEGNFNYKIYKSEVSVLVNDPLNRSNSVTIFPNPASEITTIITPFEGLKIIEIYDSRGALIMKNENTTDKLDLSISKLKSGFYFCIVKTNESIISKKFFKE